MALVTEEIVWDAVEETKEEEGVINKSTQVVDISLPLVVMVLLTILIILDIALLMALVTICTELEHTLT